MKYRLLSESSAVICLSFLIYSIFMNCGESTGGKVCHSRWANVDLTQYCGKTIGELLDDLGNDYGEYNFYGEHPVGKGYFLTDASFIFDDSSIRIKPRWPLKYLKADRRKKEWNLEDLRKEHISCIEVRITKRKGK